MFKKIKSALKEAFSYVVHGESTKDHNRKPEIVDAIVRHTLAVADTGPVTLGDNNYENRLREVLMQTDTRDLETLRDRNIAIVLDRRLEGQKNGWFDKEMIGVYYNQGKGVVALWDSGKTSKDAGFFGRSAADHGHEMLEKLAEMARDGDLDKQVERFYAGRYTYAYGKTYVTKTEWRSESDFDDSSIRKNPQLLTPPLKNNPQPSGGLTPRPS